MMKRERVAQNIVLSEIKKEDERVRNRERLRKRLSKEQTKCCPNRSAKRVAFKSPQSLGKAKKKVV